MGYKPITEEEYQKGIEAGSNRLMWSLRAESVRYDRVTDKIVVVVSEDLAFEVPRAAISEWQDLTPEEMGGIRLSAVRDALAVGSHDVQVSVGGLLRDRLPEGFFNQAFAQRGGTVRSEAKANAARANGALGGRPRKAAITM